ncbi:hypothetical protein [Rheinheimera sp.]|uniref:hypothetical protein n=1 Tax=Rheinheimera sp. TaxID=1869214 RepID=UPI00307FC5C3
MIRVLLLLLAVLLQSCSSTRPALPAWVHSEALASNYHRLYIHRQLNAGAWTQSSLLAAALLTEQQGYDWFVIEAEQSQINQKAALWQPGPAAGCSTAYCLLSDSQVQGTTVQAARLIRLDIRLGTGIQPALPLAFSAADLLFAQEKAQKKITTED